MTRVWLSRWEWACCGDAFMVGDAVDLGIELRDPTPELAESLGPTLTATVDAMESHHDREFDDRVRGRVTALHAVTLEIVERPVLRRPGHGAPLSATMPDDGKEWPMVGRDLGNGTFAGSRPSRYMTVSTRIPGSAALTPAHGVRIPEAQADEAHPSVVEFIAEPPPERHTRSLAGWLVDVEETDYRP